MAPDPPTYPIDENLPSNYDAALAVVHSDDSDNEHEGQGAYEGYTLLGQNELIGGPLPDHEDSDLESDDVIESGAINGAQADQGELVIPPTITAGRMEVAALWNSAPDEGSSNSITMDDERSAQIKAAMAGFSLPPSAVPAWASTIPEELWKEKILDRLQSQTSVTEPSKK